MSASEPVRKPTADGPPRQLEQTVSIYKGAGHEGSLPLTNQLEKAETERDGNSYDQPPLLGERETVEPHFQCFASSFDGGCEGADIQSYEDSERTQFSYL